MRQYIFLIFLIFTINFSYEISSEENLSKEHLNSEESSGQVPFEEEHEDDPLETLLNENSTATPPDLPPTEPSGTARPPSFTLWSFFLGIFVAILFLGLACFGFRYFQHRRTINNMPYTAYQ